MADSGPTWVYQLFCDHGALIYVGVATDVRRRLKQHRATKAWWPEVFSVAAYLFPSREHALMVEAARIREGVSPRYNVAGRQARSLPPGVSQPIDIDFWPILHDGVTH